MTVSQPSLSGSMPPTLLQRSLLRERTCERLFQMASARRAQLPTLVCPEQLPLAKKGLSLVQLESWLRSCAGGQLHLWQQYSQRI